MVKSELTRLPPGDTRDQLDRVSAWSFTVNPNFGRSEEFTVENMWTIIEDLNEHLIEYLIFKEGSKKDMVNVRLIAQVEKGSSQNPSVHTHFFVKVVHRCMIHINYNKIRKHFNDLIFNIPDENGEIKYPDREVKFEARYQRDLEQAILRYFSKGGAK